MAIEKPLRLLLVAPNISRNMGGEAFKALMIALETQRRGATVLQVSHSRVRGEIARSHPELNVVYVEDSWIQILLHRMRFVPALLLLNAWQLNRAARKAARDFVPDIVHFTSPISPVLPYFSMPGFPMVIGPLNGNVGHPPAFTSREPLPKKLGRWLLRPTQKLLGAVFPARRTATILVSGGERTAVALALAGCSRSRIRFTVDSGVAPELADRPAIEHQGPNFAFVFLGRLVRYKAADLAICALAEADVRCTLDIIGMGPEEPALRSLAQSLGVHDRVRFLGWVQPGPALYDRLGTYRAMVFPSLAEANGIVFQEAMMLGLPVVGLRWAGPAQLFEGIDSMLVDPGPQDEVITSLARAMNRLAIDPAHANRLAAAARQRAMADYGWGALLADWHLAYHLAIEEHRRDSVSVQ
ncbi:glycosyltransferase family 4 protein [Sphingomonas sp. MG17]|uniref:Glycosyltransferase family 4 protein n=1 Tax=Sphingomonas tagetis TaxID=2949092 RepID=A0A9X2HNW7_9SPHN|nr:glycosyltransferase family 4 protein [Sphingomonas tagetis]